MYVTRVSALSFRNTFECVASRLLHSAGHRRSRPLATRRPRRSPTRHADTILAHAERGRSRRRAQGRTPVVYLKLATPRVSTAPHRTAEISHWPAREGHGAWFGHGCSRGVLHGGARPRASAAGASLPLSDPPRCGRGLGASGCGTPLLAAALLLLVHACACA